MELNSSKLVGPELAAVRSVSGKAVFIEEAGFQLLSLRSVKLLSDELKGENICYLIKNSKVYQVNSDDTLKEISVGQLLNAINENTSYLRSILNFFLQQIDDLEDILFERKVPRHFVNTWFSIKRDIAIMARAFARNAFVLREYMEDGKVFESSERGRLDTQIDYLEIDMRNCKAESDRLDTIFNFYTSLKNEKLNLNLYMLALVSGVFLPLNLVVGFFGMNTEGMFFSGDAKGTLNVVWILSSMFLILLLGLPVFRKIDHYILSKILGRSNIYKYIQKNLHSFKVGLDE